MAKPIVVSYKGKESSFDHGKLDRAKLYGKKKRVALDSSGEVCIKASLDEDGTTLIRSGMTAQGYFENDGAWVPNKELVGLDEKGKPLELQDSTLGAAQTVEVPAPAALHPHHPTSNCERRASWQTGSPQQRRCGRLGPRYRHRPWR